MEYSLRPLVIEIPIDSWLADSIGTALLVLIVAAILKVVFGSPPERRGASEMRPHLGGYQPRDTPPTMQRPPFDGRRPPPPKPINRHHDCECCNKVHGMTIPPPPPRRRCPSKGFGEPISCDECDRGCPPGKK